MIENKILIEFDYQTLDGFIYPKETAYDMMMQIKNGNIGGKILTYKDDIKSLDDVILNGKSAISFSNPFLIIDDNIMKLTVNVEIDESMINEDTLELLKTNPWRLSLLSNNDTYDNGIIKINIKQINIEIYKSEVYNVLNKFLELGSD